MIDKNDVSQDIEPSTLLTQGSDAADNEREKKGPISFLSGALTSGLLGWICLLLSTRIVIYFSEHKPSYSSPFAQSIASGFKTLIIGTSFLMLKTYSQKLLKIIWI